MSASESSPMRTGTAAVALTLLLVTAGCAGIGGSAQTPAPSTSETGGRTIEVAATGDASASPNLAVVVITVAATADDAATARKRMERNVSRVESALLDLGLDASQLTTVRYDIDRERRERMEGATRYRAVHTLRIRLTKLDRVGPVIDTAVANGATGIEQVQYTLSSEKRKALRKEALRNAMDNARGQAVVLAEQAGLNVTGVARVQATEYGGGLVRAFATAAAGDSAPRSGSVSVSVRVVVTYNATAASG